MKRSIWLAIFLVILSSQFNATAQKIWELNSLSGNEKWRVLRQYLLEQQSFSEPPNREYKLQFNNILLSFGYSHGLKKTINKNGKWIINENEEYIYFEIPNLWTDGFYRQKFFSYKVHCGQMNDNLSCQIIFYTDKIYKEPENLEEAMVSGKYLHLSPLIKR